MGAAAVPLAIAGLGYQVYSNQQQQKEQKKALEAQANKPVPVPTPMPSATDSSPMTTELARQRKLAAMQYGFASTISKSRNPMTPGFSAEPLKTRLGQ